MFHRIIKQIRRLPTTASDQLAQRSTQSSATQQPQTPVPLIYRITLNYLRDHWRWRVNGSPINGYYDDLRADQSPDALGFSLLESLMAVVVVTVLLVGIAPMLALSTATRVNARRVDQAVQAARTYSDAVRSGIVGTSAIYQYFPCPSQTTTFPCPSSTSTNAYFFDTVGAPGAASTTNSRGVTVPAGMTISDLFNSTKFPGVSIDTNGNGFSTTDPQDLVIMPIRSAGAGSSSDLDSQGFVMVLRVYRADAFNSTRTGLSPLVTTLKRGDEPECTNTILTGSAGSRSCPLAQVRYEIFPTTITYDGLKTRL